MRSNNVPPSFTLGAGDVAASPFSTTGLLPSLAVATLSPAAEPAESQRRRLLGRSVATVSAAPSLLGASGTIVSLPSTSRSEEHTSELQSLMRISYAVFCLKKKKVPT